MQDEDKYIESILSTMVDTVSPESVRCLIMMVKASHGFVRAREDPSAVSMRDVRRCKTLAEWFYKQLQGRGPRRKSSWYSSWIRWNGNDMAHADIGFASVLLAVAHCYRSRLPMRELRIEYDEYISREVLVNFSSDYTANWVTSQIRIEQLDYASRMEIDPGIALNDALLENIFVLLVCIQLRIPVFLVGKPVGRCVYVYVYTYMYIYRWLSVSVRMYPHSFYLYMNLCRYMPMSMYPCVCIHA